MRMVLIATIFLFIFTGCSKKATVSTYSSVNVPIENLKYVHLNIEGSELFTQKLYERIPIIFLEEEILVDDPTSKDILHIIENKIQKTTDVRDSEETKEIKYITRVYNKNSKQLETRVTYVDRIYFKRCWIDTFELSSSVTTRYKRDTIKTSIPKETCRIQRYNIFFKPTRSYDEDSIYNQLVIKLRDKIINYLVPYRVYYDIELEEELDVELSKVDKEEFESILEQIDNGIILPTMVTQLEVFDQKYPNSATINFTIGVLYEVFANYEKALVSYTKALEIDPKKKILKRINKVKNNRDNLEKIHG